MKYLLILTVILTTCVFGTKTFEFSKEYLEGTNIIAAIELSKQYQENGLKASLIYNEKFINIIGTVKSVEMTTDKESYWIKLEGNETYHSVYISFTVKGEDLSEELRKALKINDTLLKACKLKQGDVIQVKVKCLGKDKVSDIICSGFNIKKIEPIKTDIKTIKLKIEPIKVTNTIKAVELSREFQDNLINAGQNFENQEFDIIGTVERIKKLNNKSFTIELKGCGMYNLVCIRFYNNKNLFKKACELIPSDFIRVRAICIKYDYSDVICSGINFKKIRTEEEGFNQRTLGESKPIEKEIKPFEELPKYGTITLKNGKEYYGELIERTNEGITIKTELFKAFYKWKDLSNETVEKYKLD